MIDYVVFFGLLAAGVLAFALFKPDKTQPQVDPQYVKCESYIERRLYRGIITRGYYAQTQVSCGKYRIDIALPTYKLAIECDGKAYHSSPEQKAHDRRKNAYLRRRGWRVLRFSGSEINGNLSKVLARIEKAVHE